MTRLQLEGSTQIEWVEIEEDTYLESTIRSQLSENRRLREQLTRSTEELNRNTETLKNNTREIEKFIGKIVLISDESRELHEKRMSSSQEIQIENHRDVSSYRAIVDFISSFFPKLLNNFKIAFIGRFWG